MFVTAHETIIALSKCFNICRLIVACGCNILNSRNLLITRSMWILNAAIFCSPKHFLCSLFHLPKLMAGALGYIFLVLNAASIFSNPLSAITVLFSGILFKYPQTSTISLSVMRPPYSGDIKFTSPFGVEEINI